MPYPPKVYENKSTSSPSASLSWMYFRISSVPIFGVDSSFPNKSIESVCLAVGDGFAASWGLAPGSAGLEAGSLGLELGTAGFVGRLGFEEGWLGLPEK